jgi:hypothetical protein
MLVFRSESVFQKNPACKNAMSQFLGGTVGRDFPSSCSTYLVLSTNHHQQVLINNDEEVNRAKSPQEWMAGRCLKRRSFEVVVLISYRPDDAKSHLLHYILRI